jgi:hypothetical protein
MHIVLRFVFFGGVLPCFFRLHHLSPADRARQQPEWRAIELHLLTATADDCVVRS